MTLPDPSTFIGNPCVISLKDGHKVIRTILKIDTSGVLVDEGDGRTHTYQFAEIANVRLER